MADLGCRQEQRWKLAAAASPQIPGRLSQAKAAAGRAALKLHVGALRHLSRRPSSAELDFGRLVLFSDQSQLAVRRSAARTEGIDHWLVASARRRRVEPS